MCIEFHSVVAFWAHTLKHCCLSNLATFICCHSAWPFSFSLIILPAAVVICHSQQFTLNKAQGRATKERRHWANKLGGRLNNCGLSAAWGKHNPVVCVYYWLWLCICVCVSVFLLAANMRNKSVSAPCISTRPQLFSVFQLNPGVSAVVFVELSLCVKLLRLLSE